MDESHYKLVIGLYLQNKANAGMQTFAKSAEGVRKQAKAIQEQLDKIRMSSPGAKNATEAQRRLIGLAKQEADIREKMALATTASARREYRTQLEALKVIKAETAAKAREYSADEIAQRKQQAAAAKAQIAAEKLAQLRATMANRTERDLLNASKAWASEVGKQERAQQRAQMAAERLARTQAAAAERTLRANERQERAAQRAIEQAERKARIEAQAQLRARQAAAQAASERQGAYMSTAAFVAAPLAYRGRAMIGDAFQGAADLESAMVTIRNATTNHNKDGTYSQTTPAQVEQLRQVAFDISQATAQSVTDSANILAVMASSGINDPQKLRDIALPMAKFADVQFLGPHHTSFTEATKQGIQLAHLYGRYSGKPLEHMLDSVTKVSAMMPDDLSRYVTQAGYYMPAFRRLGVSDDQSIVAGAFMDRMGLGRGKGGTGLQNFIMNQMQALALTKHSQQGKKTALEALGLLNNDGSARFYKTDKDGKNPHFDVFGALEAIDKSITSRTKGLSGKKLELAQGKAVTDVQSALGITGGRIGFLGTSENIKQLHEMIQQIKVMPGMDEAQARYMNTVNGQLQLFKSNFGSLLTELMWPWMDNLRSMFSFLATKTHDIQTFFHAHRGFEQIFGLGVLAVVGGTMALVTAQMWMMNMAIWRLGSTSLVATAELNGAAAGATAASAGMAVLKSSMMIFARGGLVIVAILGAIQDIQNALGTFGTVQKALKQGQNPLSIAGNAGKSWLTEQGKFVDMLRGKITSKQYGAWVRAEHESGRSAGLDTSFSANGTTGSKTTANASHITVHTTNHFHGDHKDPKKHAEVMMHHFSRAIASAAQGSGTVPSLPFMSPSQMNFTPGAA